MSLILDALKRAERERRGEAGPAPAELPPPSVRAAPRRERDWVWTAVVVGGLGLSAFLLWDAFRKPTAPAAPPAAPAPQAQAPAAAAPPAQAPAPVIVARPAPPPASVVPGTEGVASLDDLTDEPVLEGAPAAPLPKPVPARPAPAKPAPPATAAQRPDTIATTPAPPPAPAEVRTSRPDAAEARPEPSQPVPVAPAPVEARPAEPPPAEVPPALTQPAPLRKFREMPPDYRADFPALRVEIHVYEKEPARRFVMINGRRYREGERLAEGPALVEIVPEGMVLEHRGETVLYTLGR
jgi:general secretion pathway protein B